MESISIATVNTTSATTTVTVTASFSASGVVTNTTTPSLSGLSVGLTLAYDGGATLQCPSEISLDSTTGNWSTDQPWDDLSPGNAKLTAYTYLAGDLTASPRASSAPVSLVIAHTPAHNSWKAKLLKAKAKGSWGGGNTIIINSPSPGQPVSSGFIAGGTVASQSNVSGKITVGGSDYNGTVLQQPTSTNLNWQIQFNNPSGTLACPVLSVSTADGANAQQTQGGCGGGGHQT